MVRKQPQRTKFGWVFFLQFTDFIPPPPQSILSYNGGAVIAMRGKNCVAVASDLRYGVQMRTVTTDFEKVFEVSPTLWVGLPGLSTDTQTVMDKLRFRTAMYELREGRKMKPKWVNIKLSQFFLSDFISNVFFFVVFLTFRTFAAMLSNMLYERRFGPFFVEPVVAGLDPATGEGFLSVMDLIGCQTTPDDFVVAGTAEEQLYGQ